MRSVKRIIKIQKIEKYKIYCLFNNGESRIIDFKKLFKKWNVKKGDEEYPLMKSVQAFQKVKLKEGTLAWENIQLKSEDEKGKKVFYEYDIDQLAKKSGTSKHYISRIENNKSGIELSTLIKIVEGGLGKRLQVNIV